MGIADFFRPKHRHSDVRVRTEAVKALTADDAAILEQVAKTDADIGVRKLAMERIDSAAKLAELYEAQSERSLRAFASERAAQLWTSDACGDDVDEAMAALSGIIKLGDQHGLVEVVVNASLPAIRKRAFGELRDPKALAELAKSEAPQEIRAAAVAQIDNDDVLRALAIDTTTKEVGLAAVAKLDDIDRLENVAQKAKNKAVRQKARKIVAEIVEAQRASQKPVVPDEVKRRRAEKAQLVRELEALADTFDFARATETVKKAEAAWAGLGEADDGDERFTKAVERFWRRKETHEQTTRSADELRAVEREAQAERDRAAAERAAKAKAEQPEAAAPEADDYVRPADPSVPDPKRDARDAEAKARREEREAKRVEEDAKRAAQQAEREARAKEDAVRGAAIAASLEALVGEMETLAEQSVKDTKAIDRLLASAGKSFDGIGKVPAADRDTLAERYRVVRAKLVTKAGELREAEDWQRWANVPKAEALIDTAKQLLAATDVQDLGGKLKGLQALWKEVGPMPQKRSKELWEQFKALCDQIYDQVKGVRAVEAEKFADVTKAKEALIAEAEALADSTDWAATAERLKALQAQWKQSGHLPRKQGDELWTKFRAACDRFFERRKPMLDARHDEELANLQKKQALIARASQIAAGAPGVGGWGKAIGEIKDLQAQWKEIGYVPRKDADAVYAQFRTACDALFKKRDESRDAEANAHRAELDGLRAEITAVMAGGDDVVARAIAARTKASELDALAPEVQEMIRHLVSTQPDAVKGTELDPTALRNKREKLCARAEELLPKQAATPAETGDIAAQLKQAMRKNAFGDLRFSGRDPVEVVEELRASWADAGPILDDTDRAQHERFEATLARVLEAAGASATARPPRASEDDSGRRRRRERPPAPPTTVAAPEHTPLTAVPDAAGSALAAIATPEEVTSIGASVPVSTHDALTQPAKLPPEVPVGIDTSPAIEAAVASVTPAQPLYVNTTQPVDLTQVLAETDVPMGDPTVRTPTVSGVMAVPEEDLDSGWDLGDDDPTAGSAPAADESTNTPSSGEMAGDGSVEGDGLDQVD